MPRARHRRLVVGGGVALALAGMWLGHTAEYVRVWGGAGLGRELFASMHAYMLPLGCALALLAGLAGAQLWRVWAALGRRLDAGRLRLRALWRGHALDVPAAAPQPAPPSFWAGIAAAWPALTALQIALYVFQENVEATVAGLPAPGLGAVTGVHGLAPLVHAGVALLLLAAAGALSRLLHRRAAIVASVEAIARALRAVLATIAPLLGQPRSRDIPAPLQLLGVQLRRRPPPALLSV